MVGKRLSLLDIEAPKEFTSSTSSRNKDNLHLSLPLFSKAPLAILILLASKKVSNNFTPSVFTISIELNLIKLGLTNVNNILTLTSIEESLNPNQIILQDKIRNQLGKLLEV